MIHATLDSTTAISCSTSPSRLNTSPRRFGSSNGLRCIAAATALLAHIPAGLADTPPWTIHAIPETGTPGVTTPYDVSDSGYVVGLTNGGAFRYHIPTAAIDRLEWPGALEYTIPAVNNAGVVAISVRTASGWQGYRWDGQWHAVNPGLPLPPFSGVGTQSKAIDINDFGEIAGEARFEGQDPVGYMWDQAGVGHQLFWWPGYDGESMSFPGNRSGSTYTINNNHIVTGNSGWWLGSISWIGSQTVQKDSLFSQVPTKLNDANLGTIGKSLVQVRGTPSGYAIDTLGTYNTGNLAYAGSVAANRLALAAPCGGVACNTGAVLAGLRYSIPLASMLANPAGWDIDVWRYGSPPANTSKISNNGRYIVGGGYLNNQYVAYYATAALNWSYIPKSLQPQTVQYGDHIVVGNEVFSNQTGTILQWYSDNIAVFDDDTTQGSASEELIIAKAKASSAGSYRLAISTSDTNAMTEPQPVEVVLPAKQRLVGPKLSAADTYPFGIWTLCETTGGELVIGGDFIRAGNTPVSFIAKWNGLEYTPLGDGLSWSCYSVNVCDNGDILASGNFARSGSKQLNGVGRWTGQTWIAMGAGFNNIAWTTAVTPEGTIYAGGSFTSSGATPINRIAKWDGQAWQPLGTGMNGTIRSIAVLPNGDIVAGGKFSMAGGVAVNNIARWDGSVWHSMGDGVNNSVSAVHCSNNGTVFAGGRFTQSGNLVVNHVAKWDGAQWSALGTGVGDTSDDWVYGIAELANGNIVAGGFFATINGRPSPPLACWNGTQWESVYSEKNDGVLSALCTKNGRFYTGTYSTASWPYSNGNLQGGWNGNSLSIVQQPFDQVLEHGTGATFVSSPNYGFAELAEGVQFQWYRDAQAVVDGPGGASAGGGVVSGASGIIHSTGDVQLKIDDIKQSDAGGYSVRFFNRVEEVVSDRGQLTVTSRCLADLNADGFVDDSDFPIFVVAYNVLDCADPAMTPGCPADLNSDGFVDDADFTVFVVAYNALLCP